MSAAHRARQQGMNARRRAASTPETYQEFVAREGLLIAKLFWLPKSMFPDRRRAPATNIDSEGGSASAREFSAQVMGEPYASPVKYVLHPGRVRSKNDGDTHYVGAADLARLYGVSMNECRVYDPLATDHCRGLIALAPRFDGRYVLPTA